MFPFVYGFTYDAGNLIFLGIFFSVLIVIGTTLILATLRATHSARQKKAEAIRWHEDFLDLPVTARACRHELNGELKQRICPNGFDCRQCDVHASLLAHKKAPAVRTEAPESTIGGFEVPNDRLYHRGHTWVQSEEDGTMVVGLDDFARRLIGNAGAVELPAVGTVVQVNGIGWRMSRGKQRVRVLAPVDGTVVETGGPDSEWFLRVRPAEELADVRHLLNASEARAWMLKEIERLQLALGVQEIGPALADGGVPVRDIPASNPDADWDKVWGDMLLEP